MAKRKRDTRDQDVASPISKAARPLANGTSAPTTAGSHNAGATVQIITGSYERALHGIIAHVPSAVTRTPKEEADSVTFADSFLFNAHTSSVRCLALSPPSEAQKIFLASGGTDERINVYSLTTVPPAKAQPGPGNGIKAAKPSALDTISRPTVTNAANKEVGTLNHHAATVTSLTFPTRTKLLSGAADNSIAVLRTRDWEVLSSLRAPLPKPTGRPSGDTAAQGDVPAGINDIAIHPSLKLMLSVGRGEKCMRLWNLVTGKKAGVLQFDRSLLAQVGEGKYSSGEGRRALWSSDGEAYTILFERGACVFGIDSKPTAVIRPSPSTKLHQAYYLDDSDQNVLAVSTEDGRLLFYDTEETQPGKPGANGEAVKSENIIPECPAFAQLGGRENGVSSRVKDFKILRIRPAQAVSANAKLAGGYLAVTACSDGIVQMWILDSSPNGETASAERPSGGSQEAKPTQQHSIPNIGYLIGTYETGNRITCLQAFVMDGKYDGVDEAADEVTGIKVTDEASADDDSDESE